MGHHCSKQPARGGDEVNGVMMMIWRWLGLAAAFVARVLWDTIAVDGLLVLRVAQCYWCYCRKRRVGEEEKKERKKDNDDVGMFLKSACLGLQHRCHSVLLDHAQTVRICIHNGETWVMPMSPSMQLQ